MRRRRFLQLGAGMLAAAALPAQAQLVLVSGDYRIVALEQDNERVAIALPEDNPQVSQNWIYVSPKTDVTLRITNGEGWYKEERLNFYQFFERARQGEIIKVQGGRRWDGAITAKTIWMGTLKGM